jgi:hypothetical protein
MIKRIELVWPDKGALPLQLPSGAWARSEEDTTVREARPLTPQAAYGERPTDGLVVTGDRLAALRSLRHTLAGAAKLVYADLPRVEGYDETRAFRAEDGKTWATWLTVVREHLAAALTLLARDGVLVIQGGDREEAYAKVLAYELLGPDNIIGSIVWQSHYSAKGGKPGSEIATVHETLVCTAREREAITQIALPRQASGYANPDDDPRGPWKAPQKDAGRDTVKLKYNAPPYEWRIVGGSFPAGLWRLSPFSGVIWGIPQQAGEWKLKVAVKDHAQHEATREFTLRVTEEGDAPAPPERVWWMDNPPMTGGSVKISSRRLPGGVLGHPYSLVLEAEGGEPQLLVKRPSRGWGFGEKTLIAAILEDRCYFGRDGRAIPEPKRYLAELDDGISYANVTSWWSGEEVGWSQDATKHLRDLKTRGLIEEVVETAKPESLVQRLIEAFTAPGDLVVELFARAGDAAAVSMRLGRSFVSLSGGSDNEVQVARTCSVLRLRAVLDCESGASQVEPTQPIPAESAVKGFTHVLVDDPVAITDTSQDEFPRLVRNGFKSADSLIQAVLTSQGFLPVLENGDLIVGRAVGGREEAFVLRPEVFLDRNLAADLVSRASTKRTIVYFFRCEDDFDQAEFTAGVSFRRIPMDLAL